MIDSRTSKVFRGIAILMVIASHFAGGMYGESVNEAFRLWISTWGVYGVDIFFLLSGYGLVKSYQKNGINKRFVLKRFLNSYVPYILIVGFFSITDKTIDTPRALFNFIIGYGHWFLCVLFAFYIMFMVIYRIGKFKEVLLTACVISFTYILRIKGFSSFWELSNGAFLIGVYAATLEKRFGEKVRDYIVKTDLALVGFALTVVCAFWHVYSETFASHMTASMMFTVMTLGLCVQFKAGGIILPALGRYSLYIYLLHSRIFWKFVAYKEEWSYLKGAVIAGLIVIFVSVAIGFSFEWWIERISGRSEKDS